MTTPNDLRFNPNELCFEEWEEQLTEPDHLGRTILKHHCLDYEEHTNSFHECVCGATTAIITTKNIEENKND